MNRWTIKQLKETNDIDFAIAILQERINKICPYSPLAIKIKETQNTLRQIQKE